MTVNNKKLLLGSTAAMVALSPLAAQQLQAASVTINAWAAINTAVLLNVNTGLNFATLSQTAPGTVQLDFTDNVIKLGGGLIPTGGSPTSGNVTIRGLPGQQMKVATTAATYKITTLGGGAASKSMTISNINYRIGPATGANLTITPTAMTNVLDIGANLKAPGTQLNGVYTGNIKVMVTQP